MDGTHVVSQTVFAGLTNLTVDAHNGQAPQTMVDVIGVAPTSLHEDTDYLVVPKVA